MKDKQELQQEVVEEKEREASHSAAGLVRRPRDSSKAVRKIQQGQEKLQQRAIREMAKTRGIGPSERPPASATGLIQHLDKHPPESRALLAQGAKPVGFIEDRETVKWTAYGALLISLVTIVLLTLYSRRDFSPAFEYHDLKIIQEQLDSRVNKLEYSSRLERIRNAVINAQFQLFVRDDNKAAESLLIHAKEELNAFIDALPIEKTTEPKDVLNQIDRVLREIRQEPLPIDEDFQAVLSGLEKL